MEPALVDLNVNESPEINTNSTNNNNDHGWQKVTYVKRQRKAAKPNADPSAVTARTNGAVDGDNSSVFRNLEQHAEERRRRLFSAQQANVAVVHASQVSSKHGSDYEDDDDSDVEAAENGQTEEVKKVKQKKPKKPKITVAEAAGKIDAADLAAFLVDISVSDEMMCELCVFCLWFVLIRWFFIGLFD